MGEIEFFGVSALVEALGAHIEEANHETGWAPSFDRFPDHGATSAPLPPVAPIVQCLRGLAHKSGIAAADALATVIDENRDPRFKIAPDFELRGLHASREKPGSGCWFTQVVRGRLWLFWHPDPNVSIDFSRCVHHGKGIRTYASGGIV